uniref:protein phosphatase 1 regulatory subunit 35-like n=1 Tax=Halichoerus grypus TaxID=9711 RepID=UPI001659E546|nr:protein phosphatase 1 regulatory subunit 35-like [Halichoerus grypus]
MGAGVGCTKERFSNCRNRFCSGAREGGDLPGHLQVVIPQVRQQLQDMRDFSSVPGPTGAPRGPEWPRAPAASRCQVPASPGRVASAGAKGLRPRARAPGRGSGSGGVRRRASEPQAQGRAAGGRALPPPPPPPSASSFVASSRPLFLPPPPSLGPLPLSLSSCLAFLRRRRLIYYKCTFGADISGELRASADERSLRAARPERGPRLSRAARAAPDRFPPTLGPAVDPGRRPRTPRPRPRTAPEFLHDCHKDHLGSCKTGFCFSPEWGLGFRISAQPPESARAVGPRIVH